MKKNKILKTLSLFIALTFVFQTNCPANGLGEIWQDWTSLSSWTTWISNGWSHFTLNPSVNLIQKGQNEWGMLTKIETKVIAAKNKIENISSSSLSAQQKIRFEETKQCLDSFNENIQQAKNLINLRAEHNSFFRNPSYSFHDEISKNGIDPHEPNSIEKMEYVKKLTELQKEGINGLDRCIKQIPDKEIRKILQEERDNYKDEFNSKSQSVAIEQIKYYTSKLLEVLPWWVKYAGGGIIATCLVYKLIYRPIRRCYKCYRGETLKQLVQKLRTLNIANNNEYNLILAKLSKIT